MSESYGEFEATQRGYGPGDRDLNDADIDLAARTHEEQYGGESTTRAIHEASEALGEEI